MKESNLRVRTENRSEVEITKSRKELVFIWVVGLGMLTLVYLFLFVFVSNFQSDNLVIWGIKIGFALIFTGVLGFILFIQTRNAQAKVKQIYTGIVKNKKTEISKSRHVNTSRQSSHETFSILLEDKWFVVPSSIFDAVFAEDEIELVCVYKNHAQEFNLLNRPTDNFKRATFRTTESQPQFEKRRSQAKYRSESISPVLIRYSEEDRKKIRVAFFKSLFFRGILGIALMVFIFFFAFLFILLGLRPNSELMVYYFYGLLLLLVVLYGFLNRKTVRLYKDLSSNEKIESSEIVLDKMQSNHMKPSPNSAVTSGYNSNGSFFYYVKTTNNWVEISKFQYDKVASGDEIRIYQTQFAHLVLKSSLLDE